jgi:hypothetical protein
MNLIYEKSLVEVKYIFTEIQTPLRGPDYARSPRSAARDRHHLDELREKLGRLLFSDNLGRLQFSKCI